MKIDLSIKKSKACLFGREKSFKNYSIKLNLMFRVGKQLYHANVLSLSWSTFCSGDWQHFFGERPKNSRLSFSRPLWRYFLNCLLINFPHWFDLILIKLFSLFHLVLIDHFSLCINTVSCVLINQYSTEVFVSYSVKNPIAQNYFLQSGPVARTNEESSYFLWV